jgi:hypothetical protein
VGCMPPRLSMESTCFSVVVLPAASSYIDLPCYPKPWMSYREERARKVPTMEVKENKFKTISNLGTVVISMTIIHHGVQGSLTDGGRCLLV